MSRIFLKRYRRNRTVITSEEGGWGARNLGGRDSFHAVAFGAVGIFFIQEHILLVLLNIQIIRKEYRE